MSDYNPPLKDALFALHELSGLDQVLQLNAFEGIDNEVIDQVIEEAGNFARDVLAPQNVPGDLAGCKVENKAVAPPECFADVYSQFVENGWQTLSQSPEYEGMGLPEIAGAAAAENWQAANLAFALCPLLTAGAIAAIEAHASEELKSLYLPKMVTGAWTGTMNLTEPQAGSDLAAVTTKATPEGDHYRIQGNKIFITWGDHPFAENIVHLVLARLPDAPQGVRGISLFLVPKYLVNDDGTLGEQNDVFPVSVEHKLGIHGSPTCVMGFGDNDGAIGYLVGEENKGLACMFTMMNHARIEVGIQGIAIGERAYQAARDYAVERVQGRAPGVEGRATIIKHADVRRMLLEMKSQVEAMRAAAYMTAGYSDIAHHANEEDERDTAGRRLALLTPVIKAWPTEVAQVLTSLGVQIHGGMGFVEETGAAQYMRDARILPIYEGTTGIQAGDFVGRKILADEGTEIKALIGDMRATVESLSGNQSLASIREALETGVNSLESAVNALIANAPSDPNAPGAASVNLLMAAGTVLGGWMMARAAMVVSSEEGKARYDAAFCEAKLLTCQFYAEQIMPRASSYSAAAMAPAATVMGIPEESF